MIVTSAPVNKALERFIEFSTEKARLLLEAGLTDQAVSILEDILSVCPENVEVVCRLAKLYFAVSKADQAESILRQFIYTNKCNTEALYNLGGILDSRGDYTGAIDCFAQVVALDPGRSDAHNAMGVSLIALSRPEDAERHLLEAIRLSPQFVAAYNNLGNLYSLYWRLSEANNLYREAIAQNPDYVEAYNNLGSNYNLEGNAAEAIKLYDKVLEIRPDNRAAASNMLFALNNSDAYDPEYIRAAHMRIGAALYPFVPCVRPLRSIRDDGRIRLGYVSPDFKAHSVGFFIESVLRCHDQSLFEIFCYDSANVTDSTTDRMKAMGCIWRRIYGYSDSQVDEQVRADSIDILIDLAGHTSGNRLGVFAHKPAPIQVTWLGYPNTTGLQQIDFRLTDALADPPGLTDQFCCERLIRLPRTFLCYAPPVSSPEVSPLPRKPVVFCSFNNLSKVSNTILDVWVRLLHAVPESRLSLKNGPLGDAGVRSRLVERFLSRRIGPERLILSGFTTKREDHLQRYGECHIALDTFPYCGTTTTCEALWMGVPVVSLAGNSHVSRVGASLLANVGLSELVARNSDEYVDIAAALAQNPERLQSYRRLLRTKMSCSPLMDAQTFTANLERVYHWMIEQYASTTHNNTERL